MTDHTAQKKSFELYGAPWYITLGAIAVVLAAVFTQALGTDIPSTLAVCFAIGIPLYEIGKRIPIWNTYVGGGIVLAFLGAAAIAEFKLIPEKYVESINVFTSDQNFLTMFIIVLITGSVLSLDRKIMLKSFFGYFPAILGGLVVAGLFGIVGGMLFGVSWSDTVLKYTLPIMGGGNGAGAVPLSQIYEQVTGNPQGTYYSFAIIILTIANIFAIISAALLAKIGDLKPNWTGGRGDKAKLVRGDQGFDVEDTPYTATLKDVAAGLVLAGALYSFGLLMAKVLLPKVFGFPIHQLAYMIIAVVILAATGLVPRNVREGAKRLQSFFTKYITIVIMIGVGVDLSLSELAAAITVPNVVIALFIVIGCILGSAVIGQLVGFYPIDTAITAGLCMANRGGSGDIAVLGAADRMGLMAYAQLSSRLGGAIVLIIGSLLFSVLLA